MGTQGEIYAVLGKKFPVKRADKNPKSDDEPDKLLYRLNGKIISISEDRPDTEFDILDGFGGTPYLFDSQKLELRVKVLKVDAKFGDRNESMKNTEALVGYAVANESYVTRAKALPPISQILSLRLLLVQDIKNKLGIEVPLSELELHLLYEFSQ